MKRIAKIVLATAIGTAIALGVAYANLPADCILFR